MFLVDDHHTGVAQRREHRGARADQHRGVPAARRHPAPQAFAVAETRVEHRERVAEAAAKARDQLGTQPDLRNQDQCLATRPGRLLDERQIHLGLAAAGNAVEKEHPEAVEAVLDAFERGALGRVERDRRRRGEGWRRRLLLGRRDGLHHPLRGESPQALPPGAPGRGERAGSEALGRLPEQCESTHLHRGILERSEPSGAPRFGEPPSSGPIGSGYSAASKRRGQRTEQHFPRRMVKVVRGPAKELDGGSREQGFSIDRPENRPQTIGRHAGLVAPLDHESNSRAAAKGHAHPHARFERNMPGAGGRQVVEKATQPRRHRHPDYRRARFLHVVPNAESRASSSASPARAMGRASMGHSGTRRRSRPANTTSTTFTLSTSSS